MDEDDDKAQRQEKAFVVTLDPGGGNPSFFLQVKTVMHLSVGEEMVVVSVR